MEKSASEMLYELELRVASLELEARIAELEALMEEDSGERLAVKHLSPAHARAISKGQKKSWRGNQSTRIKSMNKSRNKSNPDRSKNRRKRKLYKRH